MLTKDRMMPICLPNDMIVMDTRLRAKAKVAGGAGRSLREVSRASRKDFSSWESAHRQISASHRLTLAAYD